MVLLSASYTSLPDACKDHALLLEEFRSGILMPPRNEVNTSMPSWEAIIAIPDMRKWFDGTVSMQHGLASLTGTVNSIKDNIQTLATKLDLQSDSSWNGKKAAGDDFFQPPTKRPYSSTTGNADVVFGKVKVNIDPALCAKKFAEVLGFHFKDIVDAMRLPHKNKYISIQCQGQPIHHGSPNIC